MKLELSDITHLYMDPALAESLLDNLLKNAIVHNEQQGNLHIQLADKTLRITNSAGAILLMLLMCLSDSLEVKKYSKLRDWAFGSKKVFAICTNLTLFINSKKKSYFCY